MRGRARTDGRAREGQRARALRVVQCHETRGRSCRQLCMHAQTADVHEASARIGPAHTRRCACAAACVLLAVVGMAARSASRALQRRAPGAARVLRRAVFAVVAAACALSGRAAAKDIVVGGAVGWGLGARCASAVRRLHARRRTRTRAPAALRASSPFSGGGASSSYFGSRLRLRCFPLSTHRHALPGHSGGGGRHARV
jgi:hypothetical protein